MDWLQALQRMPDIKRIRSMALFLIMCDLCELTSIGTIYMIFLCLNRFRLRSMTLQGPPHPLLYHVQTKDVLHLINPTHVHMIGALTISIMKMVVEHQVIMYQT